MEYEERYLGWSSSGELTTGDPLKSVQLQANFIEPNNYTVQFNVTALNISNLAALPIAEITWSVEGNFVRRVVSVTNGLSVSGSGQAVRVIVRDGGYVGMGGAGHSGNYIVGINVVPGLRAATQQPPTYAPLMNSAALAVLRPGFFLVAAGTSNTIQIPQNSGIISYYTTVFPYNWVLPTQLDFTDTFINILGIGGISLVRQDTPLKNEWVPIPPLASTMIFYNTTVDTLAFSLIFGIDG